VLFEVAELPSCWWDVCNKEPLVVGYCGLGVVSAKEAGKERKREENTPNQHPSGICLFPCRGLDSSIVVDC